MKLKDKILYAASAVMIVTGIVMICLGYQVPRAVYLLLAGMFFLFFPTMQPSRYEQTEKSLKIWLVKVWPAVVNMAATMCVCEFLRNADASAEHILFVLKNLL